MQNVCNGRIVCRSALREQHPLLWPSSAVIVAALWPGAPWRGRILRHSVRANGHSLRILKHLQRGEILKISHPLQLVETAGIEPASAVA